MAVRTPTRTDLQNAVIIQWTGLLNGDTGLPVELYEYGDRSIQLNGTFGAGGSQSFEGSNDSAIFVVLTDQANAALTSTAAMLKQVLQAARLVRPNITAGDGTTNLTVTLYARKSVR